MLEVGTKAPEFTLKDQHDKEHNLSDYKGQKVLLYFYPRDNTPGCTAQAQGYSEKLKEYQDQNVVVLGVSKDSLKSHQKFSEKYDLAFPILSDEDLEVIKAYNVWKEKNMYGKKTMGVVRTTYLIDEEGVIIKAFDKVKAKDDPEKMLGELSWESS